MTDLCMILGIAMVAVVVLWLAREVDDMDRKPR